MKKYSTDGHTYNCKECRNLLKKKYRDRKRKQFKKDGLKAKYKICCMCGENKTTKKFYIKASEKDHLRSECISCSAKLAKSEQYKEYKKTYHNKNKDAYASRARKRREMSKQLGEFKYSLGCKEITLDEFDHQCFKCGSKDTLHIDHHRPMSKLNRLELGNAVVLCKECNFSKNDKDPEDFYSENELAEIEEKLERLSDMYRQSKEEDFLIDKMGFDKQQVLDLHLANFYPPIGDNYKSKISECVKKWANGKINLNSKVEFLANGNVRWGDIVEDLKLHAFVNYK